MDALAVTDFPDIRTKCSIQSEAGNILLIPREGGYLFRMYVDLGEVAARRPRRGAADHARADHREGERDPPPLHARREGRRLAQRVRGRPPAHRPLRRRARRARGQPHAPRVHHRRRLPHAQRQGRAGHERLDAGRLEPRLEARARARSGAARSRCSRRTRPERQVVAQRPHRLRPGVVDAHGEEARGVREPVGARGLLREDGRVPGGLHDPVPAVDARSPSRRISRSQRASRSASASSRRRSRGSPTAIDVHLGHHHRADGRWRVYAFADAAEAGRRMPRRWPNGRSGWPSASDSPLRALHAGRRRHRQRVRRQGRLPAATRRIDLGRVPELFLPRTGPFELIDYEKVYAADPERRHLRAARHRPRRRGRRGASRSVRRERAAADGHGELAEFFGGVLLPR